MSAETSKVVTYAVISHPDNRILTTKIVTYAVVKPFEGVPATVIVN